MESSNIGTAQIADQVGTARQKAFLKKMGFLDRVGIELRERGRTLTPGSRWGPFETMTSASARASRSRRCTSQPAMRPCSTAAFITRRRSEGRPQSPAPPGRRVFTEDTSYKMRALLRLVVTKGTGRKADAPGYRVGGKTGTAQKLINGHYSKTINITSFAGVFPMDDPRYVMVMMLDDPKPTPETYGFTPRAGTSARCLAWTVSRIAPMLGVHPDKNREPDMVEVLPFVHETHPEE